MMYAQDIVSFLSILTIVGQLIAFVLIVLLLRSAFGSGDGRGLRWVAGHGLSLMLIVAGIATAGSLYFSDIALWTPCKLCWYQRIFMYPQVVLLIIALWKRDQTIARYMLPLCLFGIVIASSHYIEQVSAALAPPADPSIPCDTSGVSCASTPFFHFGYITIPMMALTAFALNALGSLAIMRARRTV